MDGEAREVLLLRDVEGLSGAEAAAALGVGLAAMKSRLHRARLELKERVEASLNPRESGS
jgi:RNA polymerase sigma-70 factor (ECF subfamily)